MKRNPNDSRSLTWLMALLLTGVMAGCGGGGGGSGTDSSTTVSGQGNFGAEIVGGTVQMVCAGRTPGATTTTSATGSFTVTAPGGAPCVIKISGGVPVFVGGPFFSIVVSGQTRANVNQLTTMLAFLLADGNPETFFTTPSLLVTKITTEALTADKATINADPEVIALLAAGGVAGFNFLETAFAADGTKFDLVLDKLGFTSVGNTAASLTFNGAPILTVNPTTNLATTIPAVVISTTSLNAAGYSGTAATLATPPTPGTPGTPAFANPTAPSLGEAGRFVILGNQAVTTTGVTAISNGDIGVSPAARSTMTGFTTSAETVSPKGSEGAFTQLTNGLSYGPADANPAPFPFPLKIATAVVGQPWATTGAMLTQARTDLVAANTFLGATNATAPDQVLPIQLGNLTLTPGVYRANANVQITTGALQLNALGDANAVWIFDITGTLTTGAPGGNITFVSGVGKAKNVFWRTSGITTIGAGTSFIGNVFAMTQVNLLDGAAVTGRLFGITDRVTMIANTVTKAP